MKKQPKYLQISEAIKSKISQNNLSIGDKLYTEHELCDMFNVSRQTIRQALSTLEQQGIVESRQGSGTYISDKKAFSKNQTKTIGVIITYFDEYIFPSIIKGIESILSDNGYTMQLACTHNTIENEARAIESMLTHDVDGFIIEPTKSALPNANHNLYNKIKQRDVPVIFLNSFYPELKFPYMAIDDVAAGYQATKYLIDNGHKNISLALKSDDMQGHLRYRGALDALNEADISVYSENIFWYTTEDIKYLEEDYDRFKRYFKNCTAIMCYNDKLAATILKMLTEHKINVPKDISLIGIDDAQQSQMCTPQLTTIAHPKKKLGTDIAENMLKLLQDRNFNPKKTFRPELIERQSVLKIN